MVEVRRGTLWSGACGGGPAGNTLIQRLLLGPGGEHCDLESRACSWGSARKGGRRKEEGGRRKEGGGQADIKSNNPHHRWGKTWKPIYWAKPRLLSWWLTHLMELITWFWMVGSDSFDGTKLTIFCRRLKLATSTVSPDGFQPWFLTQIWCHGEGREKMGKLTCGCWTVGRHVIRFSEAIHFHHDDIMLGCRRFHQKSVGMSSSELQK